MTKEKKIIIGIISILTIVIVILSYFLINKNAIIEKQAEKIELQAMETNGSNSYVTTQEHLNESSQNIAKINEFKKSIADYIEEAGGIKPEYTANAITFGDNIKGIVAKVTSLSAEEAATAQDIVKGKKAWVNGELIEGNSVTTTSITDTFNCTHYSCETAADGFDNLVYNIENFNYVDVTFDIIQSRKYYYIYIK